MCGYEGDFDQVQTESRDHVVARKEHRCYGCDETIRRGHEYVRVGQCADHAWSTYRFCLRCWEVFEALWRDGVESVQLDLNCGEVWRDPPPDVAALAFLTPDEAQARLRGRDVSPGATAHEPGRTP